MHDGEGKWLIMLRSVIGCATGCLRARMHDCENTLSTLAWIGLTFAWIASTLAWTDGHLRGKWTLAWTDEHLCVKHLTCVLEVNDWVKTSIKTLFIVQPNLSHSTLCKFHSATGNNMSANEDNATTGQKQQNALQLGPRKKP